MKILRNVHLLHAFFLLTFSIPTSLSQQTITNHCGHIRQMKDPFLKKMVLCKSHIPYFKTSLGLFQISSIDYANKLITISHNSCSSSTSQFVSPTHLSAGFPNPPQPNSLLLFNCLYQERKMPNFSRNCTYFHGCKVSSSCVFVEDLEKLDQDFHPKQLNCTHYKRVYKETSGDEKRGDGYYKIGTRISFDIPDHVPNPCDECKKPNGNCGVGLKCFCHLKECKNEVVSSGFHLNPYGNVMFLLLCSILMVDFFN